MEYICLNCNREITENFCGNCGQKKFKRIDRKYVVDELQYSLVHTNKGFFYSVKNILRNPGKTARNFIDGNRVNHYKPILLAFLLSGISTYFSANVLHMKEIMLEYYRQSGELSPFMIDVQTFISTYNSALIFMAIPIISFNSWLVFRKWGQNFYEHVIMNTYGVILYMLLCYIAIYPVLYFLKDNQAAFVKFISISMLALPVLMFWFYREFYKGKSAGAIVGRIVLVLLIGLVLLFILMILLFIVVAIVKGPDAAAYMLPPGKVPNP